MKGWTTEAINNLHKKGMVSDKPATKKSKYGNKITEIDEIKFDSNKEASRYQVLRHWRDKGAISNLELQVPFELNEGGTHSLKYIADFTYTCNVTRQYIVEDVKGFVTREYRKKRKLMLKVHKIKILET